MTTRKTQTKRAARLPEVETPARPARGRPATKSPTPPAAPARGAAGRVQPAPGPAGKTANGKRGARGRATSPAQLELLIPTRGTASSNGAGHGRAEPAGRGREKPAPAAMRGVGKAPTKPTPVAKPAAKPAAKRASQGVVTPATGKTGARKGAAKAPAVGRPASKGVPTRETRGAAKPAPKRVPEPTATRRAAPAGGGAKRPSVGKRSSPGTSKPGEARRGAGKGKVARGRPARPAAPVVRVVKFRELDPVAKCGPGTSVEHLFRVEELLDGQPTIHLVFFDRHGWYCMHGAGCVAVADVRKQLQQRERVARR